MMICNHCGQQVQDGAAQCPFCGAPLMQQMYQQNAAPNPQFAPNMNAPQQAPKKKHGCLIAVLVVVGLGFIGMLGGAGKTRQKDSAKVEVESSEAAPAEKDAASVSDVDSESTVTEESSTESKDEKNRFSYEVTNTNFGYYTNSIGDIEYYGYVEILNTGSTNLYLDDCTFDLEDNDGHLLQSDDFIFSSPDIIAPGEKGYFYNGLGSNLIDKNVSMDNGIKLVPNFKVEEARGEIVDYDISDTDMRTDDYGEIKITGRITNNTDQDDSLVSIALILYDSEGKVLAITGTSVMDLPAGSTQSFEGSTMFADDAAAPDKVASYAVVARKNYMQF